VRSPKILLVAQLAGATSSFSLAVAPSKVRDSLRRTLAMSDNVEGSSSAALLPQQNYSLITR
jgi:hypothetical protein